MFRKGFLMFSGVRERVHWERMGQQILLASADWHFSFQIVTTNSTYVHFLDILLSQLAVRSSPEILFTLPLNTQTNTINYQ